VDGADNRAGAGRHHQYVPEAGYPTGYEVMDPRRDKLVIDFICPETTSF
jgi:hypothetical protein